jgi:hypothetical protein
MILSNIARKRCYTSVPLEAEMYAKEPNFFLSLYCKKKDNPHVMLALARLFVKKSLASTPEQRASMGYHGPRQTFGTEGWSVVSRGGKDGQIVWFI